MALGRKISLIILFKVTVPSIKMNPSVFEGQ